PRANATTCGDAAGRSCACSTSGWTRWRPPWTAVSTPSARMPDRGWAETGGLGLAARVARLRVPLGFLFGGVVLWLATPTFYTLTAGGAIACAGEGLRIWAAGHLNKAREVTTSGPYRWLAHPL